MDRVTLITINEIIRKQNEKLLREVYNLGLIHVDHDLKFRDKHDKENEEFTEDQFVDKYLRPEYYTVLRKSLLTHRNH